VRRLAAPLAPELARAEYDAGLEAKAEALVIRDQMLAVIGKVNASHRALREIATAVRGGLDGSHVEVDRAGPSSATCSARWTSSSRCGYRR
jgi:hypothetical protein